MIACTFWPTTMRDTMSSRPGITDPEPSLNKSELFFPSECVASKIYEDNQSRYWELTLHLSRKRNITKRTTYLATGEISGVINCNKVSYEGETRKDGEIMDNERGVDGRKIFILQWIDSPLYGVTGFLSEDSLVTAYLIPDGVVIISLAVAA